MKAPLQPAKASDSTSQQQRGNTAGPIVDNRPEAVAQRHMQEMIDNSPRQVAQRAAVAQLEARPNRTGLPDQLKAGVENLSGYSLDDVQVHYNSAKPAQLQAHAYAQGTNIHVAPGQEKHLPHEAWHVVQQKQGRVQATQQLKGMRVNDNVALEKEADIMGAKAVLPLTSETSLLDQQKTLVYQSSQLTTVSRKAKPNFESTSFISQQPGWVLEGAQSSASTPAIHSGLVVQCVGGKKFGLEMTGDKANVSVQEGLELLKLIQNSYKLEVKVIKETAKTKFEAGDMADATRQTEFSKALTDAEMTPEGLVNKLKDGLTSSKDVISYKGQEVAHIRRDAAAYQQTEAAAPGVAAIYKRHTLDGLGAQEFVNVNGEKVRRYAWRGITPPERAAYRANTPLRPQNRGKESTAQMGYNFDPKTGLPEERIYNQDEQKVTDLEWLNSHADTNLKTIPNNPQLLSFMQTRKGVGKLLSATSTGKQITSNHGKPFEGFGRIKIDLARVPSANISHHYKQAPFTAAALETAVGKAGKHNKLGWEVDRANDTVLRNRELLLNEIPSEAVAALEDSPDRLVYEQEFKRLYTSYFKEEYTALFANSGLAFGIITAPDPVNFPYHESHYGLIQARSDIKPSQAQEAALNEALPRLDFGQAYATNYKSGWAAGYEDGLYSSDFGMDHPHEISRIPVLEAPKLGIIPPGLGGGYGRQQGYNDGEAAGRIKGEMYQPDAPQTETESQAETESEADIEDQPKTKSKEKTKKQPNNNRNKNRK